MPPEFQFLTRMAKYSLLPMAVISADLMRLCPQSVFEGKAQFRVSGNDDKECPLLVQMRLFHEGNVDKGVLLVHHKLRPHTILIRESMRKVKRDPNIESPTFNSLEICGTSREPQDANLFPQLILLLVHGVPGTYYLKGCADPTGALLPHQVYIIRDRPVGSRVLVYKPPELHPGDIRLFEVVEPSRGLRAIIGSGVNVISFSVHGKRSAVDGMANADLDGDEFWICDRKEILDTFKVSPPWEAPLADANSPRPSTAPDDPKEFEEKLAERCVEACLRPDCTIGVAAKAWLVCMDKHVSLSANCKGGDGTHLWKCLKLVDIYFEALDADKSGKKVRPVPPEWKERKQPHFMVPNRQSNRHLGNTQRKPPTGQPNDVETYQSDTVLGQVFNMVEDPFTYGILPPRVPIEVDPRFQVDGFEPYYASWCEQFGSYNNKEMIAALKQEDPDQDCQAVTMKHRKNCMGDPILSTRKKIGM